MQVDNIGTVNLVEACQKIGVNRFILVSSILVNGAAIGQILNPAYIILNVFGLSLIAKHEAEQYIRRSGINYTIIRPGGLRDEAPTGNIIMEPEASIGTSGLKHSGYFIPYFLLHSNLYISMICRIRFLMVQFLDIRLQKLL